MTRCLELSRAFLVFAFASSGVAWAQAPWATLSSFMTPATAGQGYRMATAGVQTATFISRTP